MANSMIARFVNEVAPPQYISVTRHKLPKILDTINEEDRNVINVTANINILASSSSSSSARRSSPPLPPLSSSTTALAATKNTTASFPANAKYLIKA